MANIIMQYILFKKENHENVDIHALIENAIAILRFTRMDEEISITDLNKNYIVRFYLTEKDDSWSLRFVCSARLNDAVHAIDLATRILKNSSLRDNIYVITEYDGLSEYYCQRLYPKFAKFERQLRQMILIILTKAHGIDWFDNSATPEIRDKTKRTAKSKSNLLEIAIENMDFSTMESFLFAKHIPNVVDLFNNQLSASNIATKNTSELREIIDSLRPKSLWEKCFIKYGSQETWEKEIRCLREPRNKIAHNKTIQSNEFKNINKNITSINEKLTQTISSIKEEELSTLDSVSVLGNWSRFVPALYPSEETHKAIKSISDTVLKYAAILKNTTTNPTLEVAARIAESVSSIYNTQLMSKYQEEAAHFTETWKRISESPAFIVAREYAEQLKDYQKAIYENPAFTMMKEEAERLQNMHGLTNQTSAYTMYEKQMEQLTDRNRLISENPAYIPLNEGSETQKKIQGNMVDNTPFNIISEQEKILHNILDEKTSNEEL